MIAEHHYLTLLANCPSLQCLRLMAPIRFAPDIIAMLAHVTAASLGYVHILLSCLQDSAVSDATFRDLIGPLESLTSLFDKSRRVTLQKILVTIGCVCSLHQVSASTGGAICGTFSELGAGDRIQFDFPQHRTCMYSALMSCSCTNMGTRVATVSRVVTSQIFIASCML